MESERTLFSRVFLHKLGTEDTAALAPGAPRSAPGLLYSFEQRIWTFGAGQCFFSFPCVYGLYLFPLIDCCWEAESKRRRWEESSQRERRSHHDADGSLYNTAIKETENDGQPRSTCSRSHQKTTDSQPRLVFISSQQLNYIDGLLTLTSYCRKVTLV